MTRESSNLDFWETEWSGRSQEMAVPGHGSQAKPSSAVVELVEFLRGGENRDISVMSIIDLGCGLGRNALYLAGVTKLVYGVDYSPAGIKACTDEAEERGVQNVLFEVQDCIDGFQPSLTNFDVAIDSLTSTSIRGLGNRAVFANNIHKVLKPGGLVLARAVSTEDELESALMATNPGPEANSSIWPGTNKFQKNFSKQELLEMYGQFEPLVIRREVKSSVKFGQPIQSINWWAVFSKKTNDG